MPPALEGTYIQKMRESILLSEARRRRASRRAKWIQNRVGNDLAVTAHLARKPPPTPEEIDAAADPQIGRDGIWSQAVSDENWGTRLATMYALAELVASQREANTLQREMNDLLRQFIATQGDERTRVPQQRN